MLPAYAGMIRTGVSAAATSGGAPRVCGDDPAAASASIAFCVCSPRMRG